MPEPELFSGCCYEPIISAFPMQICQSCGKFCDAVDAEFDGPGPADEGREWQEDQAWAEQPTPYDP